MNILNDKTDINFVSKIEIELSQLQQMEYYLIGTFLRTKGLNLYFYNHLENKIIPAKINYKNTIELFVTSDKQLQAKDQNYQQCTIDMQFIYFEALNMYNAEKRVLKYKEGKIKELCNLKKPNKEGIKLF